MLQRQGRSVGSAQPFPVIESLLGFSGGQITAGWAFHIKDRWKSKSRRRRRRTPGMRVGSRCMFQISSHHMKIPLSAHINLSVGRLRPGVHPCVCVLSVYQQEVGVCFFVVVTFKKLFFWALVRFLKCRFFYFSTDRWCKMETYPMVHQR